MSDRVKEAKKGLSLLIGWVTSEHLVGSPSHCRGREGLVVSLLPRSEDRERGAHRSFVNGGFPADCRRGLWTSWWLMNWELLKKRGTKAKR